MKQWLLNIRQPGKRYTVWEGIRRILLCLVLGILLGMLAKQLDLASYGGNSFWERALEWLDLRNFLSDFPFWLAVGLAIAVFAPSAFQAGDGVFFFFLGMCGYARGKGYVAAGLTTLIFTVLLLSCFSFGFWYFDFQGILYTATFLICVFMLNANPKRTLCCLALSAVLAFLLRGSVL